MTVFQVFFGLAVFALTRQYYIQDTHRASASPTAMGQAAISEAASSTESDLTQLISSFPGEQALDDPAAILRSADEFFASQQYGRAAQLYEQLLAIEPDDANTYNSLGITLHYLGRSSEALRILNEGVKVDPAYQRTWLTLGFVNSQLGYIEQAHSALTTATQLGTDTEVGQAAAQMLRELGAG